MCAEVHFYADASDRSVERAPDLLHLSTDHLNFPNITSRQ